MDIYRRFEEDEFEKQSSEKAKQMAEMAVGDFLAKKRTKAEWDVISQLTLTRLEANQVVACKNDAF